MDLYLSATFQQFACLAFEVLPDKGQSAFAIIIEQNPHQFDQIRINEGNSKALLHVRHTLFVIHEDSFQLSSWNRLQPFHENLDAGNLSLADQAIVNQQARNGVDWEVTTDNALVVYSLHCHIKPSGLCDGCGQPPLQFETVMATCSKNLDFHTNLLLRNAHEPHPASPNV